MHSRTYPSGFTLIELLIALVVLVILVSMAAPSFVDNLDRRRVINATQTLTGQIQQARSLAVTRNTEVTLVIQGASGAPSSAWCFGLTDTGDCDCTILELQNPAGDECAVAISDPTGVVRTLVRADQTLFPGVVLGALGADEVALTFEPTRGLLDQGDDGPLGVGYTFESPRGLQTRVAVNLIGRITTCSPSGALLGGITECP